MHPSGTRNLGTRRLMMSACNYTSSFWDTDPGKTTCPSRLVTEHSEMSMENGEFISRMFRREENRDLLL